MLPIFWWSSDRFILLDLLLEEISGTWGPPGCLQKRLKNEKFSIKQLIKWLFSILGDQNRVPEGWGGAAQLWVGKKLFSSNQSKITQKEISDRAHPHHQKNHASKLAVLMFFCRKKSNFRKCCRNLCGGGMQKFLAFWGDPPIPHFCRHEVLGVFDFYSRSYKFLKI